MLVNILVNLMCTNLEDGVCLFFFSFFKLVVLDFDSHVYAMKYILIIHMSFSVHHLFKKICFPVIIV